MRHFPPVRSALFVCLAGMLAFENLAATDAHAARPNRRTRSQTETILSCRQHAHAVRKGDKFQGQEFRVRNPRQIRTRKGLIHRKSVRAKIFFGELRARPASVSAIPRISGSAPRAFAATYQTAAATSNLILGDGSKNRFNLVIIGDGFTQAEQGAFDQYVAQLVPATFAHEPLKTYKNYFNVYRVNVPSVRSGVPTGQAGNTALGMYLGCHNTPRVICLNAQETWRLAQEAVPNATTILAIANTSEYGGTAYLNQAIATMTKEALPLAAELVLHELAGHVIGWNLDEYSDLPGRYAGAALEYSYPNVSSRSAAELLQTPGIGPSHLFGKTDPFLNTKITTYEGAARYSEGAYRYTENSLMRAFGTGFNWISHAAIVNGFYRSRAFSSEIVKLIESATPADFSTVPASQRIVVQPARPAHALKIEWKKAGGVVIPNATGFSLDPSQLGLPAGTHPITAEVWDPSPFWTLPEDSMRRAIFQSMSWNVVVAGTPAGTDVPTISTHPLSKQAKAGESVTFTVASSSDTAVTIQWLEKKGSAETTVGGNSTTLSVVADMERNGAKYRARVQNQHGSVESREATLTVQAAPPAAPTITADLPTAVTVAQGSPLTLSLTAQGDGLTYAWYFGNRLMSDQKSATLSIPAVTPKNAGPYACLVTNSSGKVRSATAKVTVTVPARTGPVILGPTGTVSVTEPMIVKWTPVDGALSYRVRISTMSNRSVAYWERLKGDSLQIPIITLILLKQNTDYQIAVSAVFQDQKIVASAENAKIRIAPLAVSGDPVSSADFSPTGMLNAKAGGSLTFSWPTIAGAARYNLLLIDPKDKTRTGLRFAPKTNSTTIRRVFIPGITYTWMVQGVDGRGAVVGSHPSVSFRTDLAAVVPVSPKGTVSEVKNWDFEVLPGITDYRVIVTDLTTGTKRRMLMKAGRTRNTVRFVAGRSYTWSVAAKIAGFIGPETTSEFVFQPAG